jgi:hypothetical protein
MDSSGIERTRNEGYLSRPEFRAWLESSLARLSFVHKDWADAERRYADIAERFPDTFAAPEAVYWEAICRYKATHDHTVLSEAPKRLNAKYKDSIWALKASVWLE